MVGEGYKAPPLFWLRMPPQQGLPLCLCVEARLCPPTQRGFSWYGEGLLGPPALRSVDGGVSPSGQGLVSCRPLSDAA